MKFSWGDLELDREARVLSRAGQLVPTQPLVMDLLLLLLSHRGRVVSEEVLRREVWRGSHVSASAPRRLLKEARRAIGDDGERQEQIQTVRGRGVRFRAFVSTQGGWDTSVVGRADAVEMLERRLEEAANGIGGVTLLHGPAGIGKSRTIVEFEARAEARGFRVLRGSGRVGAEGHAFHPWLDPTRELGIDGLLSPPADGRDGARLGPAAEARRFASFRDLAAALARAARDHPLLIALDDLQLADRDAIALLQFIAPLIQGTRVWILAAYRAGEGPVSDSRLRELAALGAETSTQVVGLSGLSPAEIRVLVRNQLRSEIDVGLAEVLWSRTHGNPLFALELARSLQLDGVSLEQAPSAEVEAKLARGIGALLARRLSMLTAEARALLRAASAIGIEFEPIVLQAAEGSSNRIVARVLEEAESAGLVEPASAGRRRFAHALFQEALYAQLESDLSPRLAAQHLRIAEALERLGSVDPYLLARHFARSLPAAGAERVLRHVDAAAQAAMRSHAVADAEFWHRRAVEIAEEQGVSTGELTDRLLGLGAVLTASAGTPVSRPVFERAAQLAVLAGDNRRLAVAALGYAHRPFSLSVADPAVLRWLGAARAAPCDDPALLARISSRLGAELMYAAPQQLAEAASCIEQGVAAARAHGDVHTLGQVLHDAITSQFSARDTRAWIERAVEIERCGRESGDPEIECRGLHARAAGHLELGERDAFDEALRSCQRLSRDQPLRYVRAVTRGMEAMVSLLDGRFADARAAIDESELESRAMRSTGIGAQIAGQRFLLAVEEGRLGELLPALDEARLRLPRLTVLTAAAGIAHAHSGDVESARSALASVMERLPVLPLDRNRLPTLAFAAEIAYRVQMPSAALALEPHLAPYGALGAVAGNAASYLGSIAQALGWLTATRGDTSSATRHFGDALRVHEELRSPVWRARTLAAIEEVTGARGRRRLHVVESRN